MTVDELNAYFGTDQKAGLALGYKSKGTFSRWRRKGGVPYATQCAYEKISEGKLKARREDDPDNPFFSTT